jgi:small subunit ribosomal protein S20
MSQMKKAPKKRSKSVLKRQRQNTKHRLSNKATRSQMRSSIKKIRTLAAEQKTAEAQGQLPKVEQEIDFTSRKGAIHWKTAARYKSRLAKKVARISKEKPADK